MIHIEPEKCPQDHRCPCLDICPVEAISQNGFNAPVIDKEKCSECGACVSFCPYHAFKEGDRLQGKTSCSL